MLKLRHYKDLNSSIGSEVGKEKINKISFNKIKRLHENKLWSGKVYMFVAD